MWILPGPKYYQGWLDIRDTTATGCTYEQIKEALNGYFTLNFNKIDPYNTMTISGKVRFYQSWLDIHEQIKETVISL